MVIFEIFHRFTVPQTGISKRTSPTKGTTPNGRIDNGNSDGRILAFSVSQHSSDSSTFTRTLCADRRGFLDHLRPKIFFKNVRRWNSSFQMLYAFNVERMLIYETFF
jgi:hypothetical protein